MKQVYLIKSKELYLDFLGKLKERGYTWSDGKELHKSNYWNLDTIHKFVELDFINLTARGVFIMTTEELNKNKHVEWTMDMEPFKHKKENTITTEDFLEQLDDMGYGFRERPDSILIDRGEDDEPVAFILKDVACAFDTTYSAFYEMSENERGALYNLLDRYAKTQVSERSQKFKLEMYQTLEGKKMYLTKNRITGDLEIHAQRLTGWKMEFTREEIEEIERKLMNSLFKIEVMGDWS